MYKDEINILHERIDDENLKLSSTVFLYDLVDEFFSKDYEGISKKQMKIIKSDLIKRFLINLSMAKRSDRVKVDNIFSQIETSLGIILDKSSNKTSEQKIEKIISKLSNIKLYFFNYQRFK